MKAAVRSARWLTVAAVAACAACQTYQPLELGSVRQGERVRVTLSRPVPVKLQQLTIDQPSMIDAEAVGVKDGNLVLSALWVERLGGIGSPGEGWTVTIPVDAVAQLSQRRFSKLRSALVVGAVLVGSSIGWKVFGQGSTASVTGDTGGNRL